MRRFVIRWRGGHRDPVIEAEAAIDLRDGLLEARAERIKELEQEKALLQIELAKALMNEWMQRGRRATSTLDGPTQVVAAHELRKSWRTVGRR